MKRYAPSACVVLAGLLFAVVAGGCMTVRQEFEGYDRRHVWSVMSAVAESPEYDDWHLLTNEVWHSPDEARMEVYREVQRAVREPGRKPRVERRNWRFRIEMLDTDPPSARLVSRGWSIPAYARIEGDRYFADVWEMLGQRPMRLPDPHSPEGNAPRRPEPQPPSHQRPDSRHPAEGYAPARPAEPSRPEADAEKRDPPPIDIDDVSGGG